MSIAGRTRGSSISKAAATPRRSTSRRKTEPDIFQALRFGAVLENVVLDDVDRRVNYDDPRITENTRGAYPIEHIPNCLVPCMAGHPTDVIFLTCDAFGVLPPVSRLTPAQAMYYFISGYTAKIAGTEVGVKEPQATFSTCFGAPFMPRHPGEYAAMLVDRLATWDVPVWLVNTGWTGGPYGTGERMNINHTRAMVRAALDGRLDGVPTVEDAIFRIAVPTSCPDVPTAFLQPRSTWPDEAAYDRAAARLAAKIAENFAEYADGVPQAVREAGPWVEG